MIASPSAQAGTADVLMGVATASVHDAADVAKIGQAALWALQRQTDADMIRDVTRCLESACHAVVLSRIADPVVRTFAKRLPAFDRDIGRWRMLVELAVVPLAMAEAVWKLGELNAAIAARSGARRFRLKDLPPSVYIRLSRSLLGALMRDRGDGLTDDGLVTHMERSAAAFVWLLAMNLLGEVRRIAEGATADTRPSVATGDRVARALIASEEEWHALRQWLARPDRSEIHYPSAQCPPICAISSDPSVRSSRAYADSPTGRFSASS